MKFEIVNTWQIDKIKTHFAQYVTLKFVLKKGTFDRGYIVSLQNEFSNCVVYEIRWLNQLLIAPSISTKTVEENLSCFYNCIVQFDKKAHELMQYLAATFHIDLTNSKELNDVKRNQSKNQRGKLGEYWEYRFHGKSCAFQHVKTNQYLDVQTIYGNEYGVLDTYYLLRFIQTTPELQEMRLILANELNNMQKVIEILRIKGYLKELPQNKNGALILNRTNKLV